MYAKRSRITPGPLSIPKFKFTSLRARGSWRTLLAFFLSALGFFLPTTSGRSPARSTAGLRVGSLAFLLSAPGFTWSRTSGRRSAGLREGPLAFLLATSTLIGSRPGSRRSSLLSSTAPILTLRQLICSTPGLFRSRLGNTALELSFVFTRRLRCLRSDWSRARLSGWWWAGFQPSSSWPAPLFPSRRTTLDVWRSRLWRRCYRRAADTGLRSFAGPAFTFAPFKRRS